MKKRKYQIFIAGLVLLTACTREAATLPVAPVTYTTFYNGSPDFYEIANHVLLNNDSVVMLKYNTTTSGTPIGALNYATYKWMPPGTYRLMFSDSGSIEHKLTDNLVEMKADRHQTIFLADSLGYFEAIAVEDDLQRDEKMSRIRLAHLSPDAPRVSMFIDTTVVAGLDSIAFKQVTPFVKLATDENPGFRIRCILNGEEKTLIRKSFPLLPGRSYTFILRGYVKGKETEPNKTINLSALINQ